MSAPRDIYINFQVASVFRGLVFARTSGYFLLSLFAPPSAAGGSDHPVYISLKQYYPQLVQLIITSGSKGIPDADAS